VLGEHLRFGRAYAGPIVTEFPVDRSRGDKGSRVEPAHKAFKGKGDYEVRAAALTAGEAKAEAARCHSCGGPCGKHRTCWFCLPCEVDCAEKALWVDIPYLLR
jgi:formate dehydrogenase major subunit